MSPDRFDERVPVIIGSTRSTRICPGIAERTKRTRSEQSPVRYRSIDLAEINLPMLDEPLKAALGDYKPPHTKAWSNLISSFAGFVLVFPQYDWGYPATLKNALDYLYDEWHDKPATTVTYGTRGGGLGADQIRQGLPRAAHADPARPGRDQDHRRTGRRGLATQRRRGDHEPPPRTTAADRRSDSRGTRRQPGTAARARRSGSVTRRRNDGRQP